MERIFSYFSFQGRTNRRRYWETGVTIFVLLFLAVLVLSVLSRFPMIGILFGLLLIGAVLAAFVAALANGARRLHDRGKSAWWLLLFMGLPTLLSLPGELLKFSGDQDAQLAGSALAVLGLPFSLWGFIVMGCLKGTIGPNKFGEDPLSKPLEEVFA